MMETSTSHANGTRRPEIGSGELAVRRDPSAVRGARNFARRWLAAGRAGDADEAVELLVSELVANAVLHGAAPITVRIEAFPDRVHLAVTDADPRLPRTRAPGPGGVNGRGLQIVEALSAGWGVVPRPGGGKVVWADVATGPRSSGRTS
jgi:anti-sigma regulatory factor (Ser/Thr protein kinase)